MSKPKNRLPPFVASYIATMESPAWRSLPFGARLLYLALKRQYNRQSQGAVFLSARKAAKELGCNKDTTSDWYRALLHYGFITLVEGAHLGTDGIGKSAHYRLTDEPYQGKPPTRDFLQIKIQKPVRKIRTPCPENPDTTVRKIRTLRPRSQQRDRPENPDISR